MYLMTEVNVHGNRDFRDPLYFLEFFKWPISLVNIVGFQTSKMQTSQFSAFDPKLPVAT